MLGSLANLNERKKKKKEKEITLLACFLAFFSTWNSFLISISNMGKLKGWMMGVEGVCDREWGPGEICSKKPKGKMIRRKKNV